MACSKWPQPFEMGHHRLSKIPAIGLIRKGTDGTDKTDRTTTGTAIHSRGPAPHGSSNHQYGCFGRPSPVPAGWPNLPGRYHVGVHCTTLAYEGSRPRSRRSSSGGVPGRGRRNHPGRPARRPIGPLGLIRPISYPSYGVTWLGDVSDLADRGPAA